MKTHYSTFLSSWSLFRKGLSIFRHALLSMLIGCFFCWSPLSAQSSSDELEPMLKRLQFRVGAGGFWHRSKPRFENKPDYGFGIYQGFQSLGWGIYLDLEANERWGFTTGFKASPGILHSDSVNTFSASRLDHYSTVDFTIREWEIPLSLKYYFIKGSIRPFAVFNMGVNGSSQFTVSGTHFHPSESNEPFPFSEELRTKIHVSVDVGGGLSWKIRESLLLVLDARYQNATLVYRYNSRRLALIRPLIRAELYWQITEYNHRGK